MHTNAYMKPNFRTRFDLVSNLVLGSDFNLVSNFILESDLISDKVCIVRMTTNTDNVESSLQLLFY